MATAAICSSSSVPSPRIYSHPIDLGNLEVDEANPLGKLEVNKREEDKRREWRSKLQAVHHG